MNILITSGHYYLSDKYGSEPLWGIEIANSYAKKGHAVFLVCGIADISQQLVPGVHLYFLRRKRSKSIIIETCLRALYPIYYYLVSSYLWIKHHGQFSLVHHIAPASPMSYDLFFIFRRNQKSKYLFGPLMVPPVENNAASFSHGSGTKTSVLSAFIWSGIKLIVPLLHRLFYWTINKSEVVIVPTKEAYHYYHQLYPQIRFEVIPVGVDSSFSPSYSNHDPIIIVTAPNLIARKDVSTLIKAAAILSQDPKLPNWQVHIYGTGPLQSQLQQLIHNLHLQKLVFIKPPVIHSLMPNIYKTASIFCTTSLHEPYGMTVIEALSCGVPVVATYVNSLPEIIGDAGYTFSPRDDHQLSEVLAKLLRQQNLRQRLALKAKKQSVIYRWDSIINQYLQLL